MNNKLKNKLFEKFELEPSNLQSIIGGFYTSASIDTNAAGERYDTCKDTCVDGESVTDTFITGPGTTQDKPINALTNSFSQ